MKRDEQIVEASWRYAKAYQKPFVDGAMWADNNPNWISVEERLPDENANGESDMVLVTDGEQVFHGHYWYRINDWISLVRKPTHWMPLPNPPKKGE